MSLFEELKRRKVIRVGIAYLVGAWLLVQVAELVAESFGAPPWFMQMLLVLTALGLPVALLLAWAFDLTPQGLVRDRDLTPAMSASSSRLLSGTTIFLLVTALGYFIWESRWADRTTGSPVSDTSSQETALAEEGMGDSIAVLPFENFSGNKDDEYFADGLTDTLLHKLAQIDELTVIARNSSFQFKGQNRDVREIGEILGVDVVLEGSVQRAGEQVRIIAQLVRTSDGAHLWSQNFDDSMSNIFALQDSVATAIADQMKIDLSAEQRRRMLRDGTSNPEAYDLLIRAINEKTDMDDMADVDDTTWPPVVLIRQALALDPDYSQAWAQLSSKYNGLAFSTRNSDKYSYYVAQAKTAATKAVELAPDLPEGHGALGWVSHRKGERLAAQKHFRRALELNPNDLGSMSGLALQLIGTEPEEALELLDRVLELAPTSVVVHRQKHFALSTLGRYDEAIEELEAGIAKDPDAGLLYNDLAELLIRRKGQVDEAAVNLSRFLRLSPHSYPGLRAMLETWVWVSGHEEAAGWAQLLLQQHPNSEMARIRNIERLIAVGDFGEALDELDMLKDIEDNIGQIASKRTTACLGARQTECVLQQSRVWKQDIEKKRQQGGIFPEWNVAPMVVEILTSELTGAESVDVALLKEVSSMMSAYPYFDKKFYLKAGIVFRLGQPEEALAILEKSLEDAAPGIFGLDLLGLSVEQSLLLDPMRGQADFENWQARHLEQRTAVLERMRRMETRGEIISVGAVERLATSP